MISAMSRLLCSLETDECAIDFILPAFSADQRSRSNSLAGKDCTNGHSRLSERFAMLAWRFLPGALRWRRKKRFGQPAGYGAICRIETGDR
jgi:hypothetical protein